VIEINPEHTNAYYNRGLSYYYLENYQAAIQDYTKVIELDSQYVNAYKFRGLVYIILGRDPDAVADFKKYEKLTGEKP
jgi:tetratricopeptide (TPR) repeat protein